jgi:hypothetical protein
MCIRTDIQRDDNNVIYSTKKVYRIRNFNRKNFRYLRNEMEILTKRIPCIAYMDDMNIFSNNQDDLETLLTSVNEFNE